MLTSDCAGPPGASKSGPRTVNANSVSVLSLVVRALGSMKTSTNSSSELSPNQGRWKTFSVPSLGSTEHWSMKGEPRQVRRDRSTAFRCKPLFTDEARDTTVSHSQASRNRPSTAMWPLSASFSVNLSTSGRNSNSPHICTWFWNGVNGVPVVPRHPSLSGSAPKKWFWLDSRMYVSPVVRETAPDTSRRSLNSWRALTRQEWSSRPGMSPRPASGREPGSTCRPLKSASVRSPSASSG